MRLFVLGATGKTGKELIDIALARGHELTAFVRSPAKITRRDERLTVVRGDPRSVDELCAVLAGHDLVLSALGPTPMEAMTHTTLLQECASSAIAAMKRTDVHRLSIVSSAMLFPGGGPVAAFLRVLLRHHVRDLEAMEDLVKATTVEWTIARPPRLIHAADESYRAQPNALPPGATTLSSVLSWRAVAAFMLDSAESGHHVREVVGICR
jgi:putative NADH-flavin reductase